ncbi:MAG: class I SAM-dependent methyltransferase [Patescibacteria group bacterium]
MGSNYAEFSFFTEESNETKVTRQSIEKLIYQKLNFKFDYNLSLLDVGASDGKMFLPLVKSLQSKFNKLNYVALEPDADAYKQLQINLVKSGLSNFTALNLTAQDYLFRKQFINNYFDCILFSQSFYHIPRKAWFKVINNSINRLRNNGFIIIILDSFEGPAYNLVDLITENKTQIDTFEYGYLISAEEMEELLFAHKVNFLTNSFSMEIKLKDRSGVKSLARVLGFLYRRDWQFILNNYYKEVCELYEKKLKNSSRLENTVKIITISKE